GSQARYLPTGHLIFVMGGTLHAVAFDLDRLEVRGKPIQIDSEASTSGEYAISDEGTLIYATGDRGSGNGLVWVDRQGREESLDAPPLPYTYPRLSPDGTRIGFDVAGPPERDIWIGDLRRKALERFTADGVGNPIVAWSRDGRHVAFGSERFGPSNLFLQAADRSNEPERLLVSDRIQMPIDFAADGRLLFSEEVPGQRHNIHALTLDGTRR